MSKKKASRPKRKGNKGTPGKLKSIIKLGKHIAENQDIASEQTTEPSTPGNSGETDVSDSGEVGEGDNSDKVVEAKSVLKGFLSSKVKNLKDAGQKKLKDAGDKLNPRRNEGPSAKVKLTEEILDGKSIVNKTGIFGPGTYKYLVYIILFLNICCIILLIFNKSEFYRRVGHQEVDVRLNKNIFYIYIFILFLLILQLYTLKENYDTIVQNRGPYQPYIEGLNILCIFGLSYFIYKQIDFIHTPCPEPNKNVCVANYSLAGPNEISSCPYGPFKCGDKDVKEYDCRGDNCDSTIGENFYLTPGPDPILTCVDFNGSCTEGTSLSTDLGSILCLDKQCNASDCCLTPEQSSDNIQNIQKMITDTFNDLIKPDEERILNLETKYSGLSPGEDIPGPPGPPGTPGSDTRSDITSPSSNQFSNILCPNEPGGLCKDGETGCDDKGMCEGFALISLQEKIDLEMRYKDLNNNSYKVNTLMNNLETFLLNSLK